MERSAQLALDIGVSLLESGAEVKRAEESTEKVALALGAKSCEVLTLVSFILLTFYTDSGSSVTKTRRVRGGGADFLRFERLNALSRRICEGRIDLYGAEAELKTVNVGSVISKRSTHALSMMVAFCFAFYFGGGIREAIASALCANTVQLMKDKTGRVIENKLLFICMTSFVTGAMCLMTVKLGIARDYDTVAIGNIMLLVPGISLVSSARDFISGDLLSGIMRFVESVLTAITIVIGFALPSLLV